MIDETLNVALGLLHQRERAVEDAKTQLRKAEGELADATLLLPPIVRAYSDPEFWDRVETAGLWGGPTGSRAARVVFLNETNIRERDTTEKQLARQRLLPSQEKAG